jgi:uncharacterized membrane protein
MNTQHTDVVTEYLADVERRLAGLPLLQRRELLADLQVHIATAEAERGAQSEGELIEILERLGSPEVVAAAAYQEAGTAAYPQAGPQQPPVFVPGLAPVTGRRRPAWVIALIVASAVLLLLGCVGVLTLGRGGESAPAPVAPAPATGRR